MSFDWSIVVAYWPRFWSGTLLTLKYAAIAIVIAMVWGILIGALSFRKPKILGPIVRAYICFFRETPLLVQLYFLFYGVSRYVSVSAGMMGVIALVLNDGAFVAEIVRGGLQSIDAGQSEAAYALGFSKFQTMIYFLIPQALKKVLDSLINMISIIIKDTSMLMWITICELTYQCNQVNIYSFNPVTSYLVGAGIYLILFLIVQGIRRIVKAKNNARSTSDRMEISDEGKEACAV